MDDLFVVFVMFGALVAFGGLFARLATLGAVIAAGMMLVSLVTQGPNGLQAAVEMLIEVMAPHKLLALAFAIGLALGETVRKQVAERRG